MVDEDVSLEIEIERLFEDGVRAAGQMSNAGREKGFHISTLTHECLRNIEYAMQTETKESSNLENLEDVEEESFDGVLRMWQGTELHKTSLTPKHEWGIYKTYEINGQTIQIHGHVDEIYRRKDGTEIIIDKKFVGAVPREAKDHHMRQVAYYAALYEQQTGAKIGRGVLLYVDPGAKTYKGEDQYHVFTFPIDTKAALAELDEKVRIVAEAMQAEKIVERKIGWLCSYCKWKKPCEELSGVIAVDSYGRPLKNQPDAAQQTLDGEKKD